MKERVMLVTEYIAQCVLTHSSSEGSQIVSLSEGLDVDGVIAALIVRAMEANNSARSQYLTGSGAVPRVSPITFVILPDYLEPQAQHLTGLSLRLAVEAEYTKGRGSKGGSERPQIEVLVVEEGYSPKQRCDMFDAGGIVVISSRFFCADVLHKRINLHFSVACAVLLIPNSGQQSSRKVQKSLPSLAFAQELILARNLSFYGSQRPLYPTAAPIYFVTSHTTALSYCLRTPSPLGDGRSFQECFHVSDIQVFPRFRLEIDDRLRAVAQSPNSPVEIEVADTAPSPTDLVLEKILMTIMGEVLSELQSIERRCASFSSPQDDRNGSGKRLRDDGDATATASANKCFDDRSAPSGFIRFSSLCASDVIQGSRNGFDAVVKEALQSSRGSVQPFRVLLNSLCDLQYLILQLYRLSPGGFLIALEDSVSSGFAMNKVNSWGGPERKAPWTMSASFSDLVAVATQRVYRVLEVSNRGHGKVVTCDSGDEDDDDVVIVDDGGVAAPVAIPCEAACESSGIRKLRLLKGICSSWVTSMLRKASAHLGKSVVIPSLVILAGSEASVRRVQRYLAAQSEDAFNVAELNQFVANYQSFHGVRVGGERKLPQRDDTTTRTMFPMKDLTAEQQDDGVEEVHSDSDDEKPLLDDCDGLSQAHLALRRSSQQSVSSTSVCPTAHSILLSQLPLTDHPRPTSTQSNSVTFVPHSVIEGTCVLTAANANAPMKVWVRVCNAQQITPQLLASFHFMGQCSPADDTIPPCGRIVVVDDDVSCARLLESLVDIMSHEVASRPKTHSGRIKAHLLRWSGGWEESGRVREDYLREERKQFHTLFLAKSSLTERLFASKSAVEETRRLLHSTTAHSTRRADENPQLNHNPATTAAQAMMPMTVRLRSRKADATDAQPLQTMRQESMTIVFDEREFRSTLPYQLHCRGFEVVPLTLIHGDYIISSHCAIERKSITDLTQSLQSNRLMSQMTSLSAHYRHPVLVIEFNRNSAFRLSHANYWRSSSALEKVGPVFRKLAAVVVSSPAAHVLWCRSPQHVAAICHTLRQDFPALGSNVDVGDPSLTKKKEGEVAADTIYAMRVLRTFPGVDGENVGRLMTACGSLHGLAVAPRERLLSVLGSEKGSALYSFLHDPISETVT